MWKTAITPDDEIQNDNQKFKCFVDKNIITQKKKIRKVENSAVLGQDRRNRSCSLTYTYRESETESCGKKTILRIHENAFKI